MVLLIFFVAKTAFHQVSSRRREKPKATDTTFVCSKPSLRLSPGNVFIMAVFFTTGCFSMFLPIFISKIKNLSSKRLTPVGKKSLEKVALVGYNLLFILVLCGGRGWKLTLYEAFRIIEFVMVCLEYLRVYSIHVYRQCFLWGSTHLAKYAREENMQSHSFWNICNFFCSESQATLKLKPKLLPIFDIKVKISTVIYTMLSNMEDININGLILYCSILCVLCYDFSMN